MSAKTKVEEVGFFREMDMGDDLPSMREFVHHEALPDEATLVEYLRSGYLWWKSPGLAYDAIAGGKQSIATTGIRTDGKYAWPDSLAYYVARYHVALPSEFVDYARSTGWTIPEGLDKARLTF